MEASDELHRSCQNVQLEKLQNDPGMVESLFPIVSLEKIITDTVIKIETLIDTMEPNIRRIVVTEIEKQEDSSMISKQCKELYNSGNVEKTQRKKDQKGRRMKRNATEDIKTHRTPLRQAVTRTGQKREVRQKNPSTTTENRQGHRDAEDMRLEGSSNAFFHSSRATRISIELYIIVHTGYKTIYRSTRVRRYLNSPKDYN